MNSSLSRGGSKCKGPEVERIMVCLRNRKKEQLQLGEPGKVRQTRLEEDLVLPLKDPSSPVEERERISNYMIMRRICR